MKKFGRLTRDTAYFLKGTEFEITNEDEGFWTDESFYAGRIDGLYLSFDKKDVEIIYDGSYTGEILKNETRYKRERKEEWWEYTNYP